MLVFTQVSSMKTSRLAAIRPWWVFQRSRFLATSGRSCSAGRAVFFKAQSFCRYEYPHRSPVGLDAASLKLGNKLARRERGRPKTLTQPIGDRAGQGRLLVTVHLPRLERSRLAPPLAPLRQAGRGNQKRFRYGPVRLARGRQSQRAFPQILRVRSRHPCWPPTPAPILNHFPTNLGIPIPSNRSML